MPKIYHKLSDFDELYGDDIPNVTVLHKGTFSAEYLYYMMREWLIDHDWVTRKEPDFRETYYEHKETAHGDEIYVRWCFKKKSDAGFSQGDPHIFYELDVRIHIMFMHSKEIMVDGQKRKANDGEVEVKLIPRMIFDPGWEWKGWMASLKPLIFKRVYLPKFDDIKTNGLLEIQAFGEVLKTYFQIAPGSSAEHQEFFLTHKEGR